jgi:excisionase family DNA binding protein
MGTDTNIVTDSPYLTVVDVARLLQITRATVYGWIFRRILPHVKIGRFVRIKRSDLEEFLRLRRRGDFSNIPDGRTQTRPERW